MSWSICTKPDGKAVQVWAVTDQNDTPEGAIAAVGQIVVKEQVLYEGVETTSVYVMDRVPAEWKLDGNLPASVRANEPQKFIPGPDQYLWNMDINQLRKLADVNGLPMKKGAIKKDYVKALFKFDQGAEPEEAVADGPSGREVLVPAAPFEIDEPSPDDD